VRSGANTDLKVGLTVLIGLALLLIGIGMAKGWHLGSVEHLLFARFPTAGGIETGDPVFIRGIKHGTVTEISSLSSRSDVVVTMNIDQEVSLHEDAKATIMMLELMSGKKVEIEEGTSERKALTAKDTIQGSSPGDLSSLVTVLNSLSGNLPSIVRNLDTVLNNLTDFFGNGTFKMKAYSTIDDADRTLNDLHNVLTENRESLKRTMDQADTLTRELNSTIVSLRPDAKALIDSMRTFLRGAGRTLSGADNLLESLNEMMAASKDKKSLLYRLTNDKEMANRFDSLLINGHRLIEQIRLQGVDANIRFFESSKPLK
jgi:phospholipid/cholesterol/gamma-HCH transport system substrate-binding protein